MAHRPPFPDESINDWLNMRNASQGPEQQAEAPIGQNIDWGIDLSAVLDSLAGHTTGTRLPPAPEFNVQPTVQSPVPALSPTLPNYFGNPGQEF
jgi:hypothetical protein